MGDSDEQKKLIQDWLAVNPGTEDEARFYLEANNWDLNAALSNFYEAPPMSEGLPLQNQEDSTLPQDPTDEPAAVNAGPIRAAPTAAPISSTPANTSVPRRRYGPGARIATLSSLNSQDNDYDDVNSANQPQEWYAGGERSGMAVQPPPNPEGGSLVDRIMRRALEERAAGGSSFPPSFSPEQHQSNPIIFTGRGQTELNGSDGDEDEGEIAVRNITFWRNGFSIGDNAFYNTEDPANRHILESILQGRAPQGIFNVKNGQRVEMRVTDRHGEDYVSSPPTSSQPFSGQGRRLGGIAPTVDAGAAPLMGSVNSGSNENPIELDSDQPTVQVQIRLADGSRLIAKVNPSHTIGHLRAFVLSQRPDAAGNRPFAFKAVMPPKVLDDDSATIKDTGIANATIAQHFV